MTPQSEDVLGCFHPAVAGWFRDLYREPTHCQVQAWRAIRDRRHTLIAAPTGSGKTLAAFLAVIDDLAREAEIFGLPAETRVLYVSPLKALSNDIHKNLEMPLDGIHRRLFEAGASHAVIRSQVRTGDTPALLRAAMVRQPPHLLVTTPESLYILLTSESGRRVLRTVRTAIIDEIHAVVATKRGAHLALSLERLVELTGHPVLRIGLSATQNPIDEIGRFLTGGRSDCVLIDLGQRRSMELAIELPQMPLDSVLSHQAAGQIYDRMAELIQAHRTTLVFVNTRRLAERVARALTDRLGHRQVTSHHGSLSREQRLSAEDRLKGGKLRALVATASLELGIDIGEVDLVCQLGSTGVVATFLQRVGRSGHRIAGTPNGRLFPTTRDDLMECVALLQAARRGQIERLNIVRNPLDVLAQQIVAMVAAADWSEDALYRFVTRAYPYCTLTRVEFDEVIRMVVEGYGTNRGTRGAYLHRDGINKRLRARSGARLTAVTCGGAIPDNAEYRVVLEPGGEVLGAVDEHFAIESVAGDVFQLGNASWRVLGLDGASLRVVDAQGQIPSIPFWFGEAPGRSHELSAALSALRGELVAAFDRAGPQALRKRLSEVPGLSEAALDQATAYMVDAIAALGALPTLECIVFERFFDASGGMQFVIHSPFGSRVNRAWGLALRKRFCRTFNFELQAAANEDALLLSLGRSQSFALEEVKQFLNPNTVRELLIQALLDAPMFIVRWRWNAVCSLAVKRFSAGRKVRPHLLRMQAEDLVTAVFPDQLACLENIVGDRQIPDHPLVRQTIDDCLTEAMDVDRLIETLAAIAAGAVRVVCLDLAEPSPLAAEIINAKVYSFLDGAPLEERRTRAVSVRRVGDGRPEAIPGLMDPSAVERVRHQVWPEVRNIEEMHDALQCVGFFRDPAETTPQWIGLLQDLAARGRSLRLPLSPESSLWIAAERWPQFRAIYPDADPEPRPQLPRDIDGQLWQREDAVAAVLRSRLTILGPISAAALAEHLAVPTADVQIALAGLEQEGAVLRGMFPPRDHWCDRGLAARIQRYTREARRQDVRTVAPADFMAFLVRWQHVDAATRGKGAQALAGVLRQLEAFDVPAAAWEDKILAARVDGYASTDLDWLCQSGQFAWLRLRAGGGARTPVATTPIVLLPRREFTRWLDSKNACSVPLTANARRLEQLLGKHGALFYDELLERGGLLPSALEDALAELVSVAAVTADAFSGLRALLVPSRMKHRYKGLGWGLEHAGRWSLLASASHVREMDPVSSEEYAARVLLRRYGVVFRALLAREVHMPPWSSLVRVFRQLEARGEIRGGRFVSGGFGEQYALPEVLEPLWCARDAGAATETWISVHDPLNLNGVLYPGKKLPATIYDRILLRAGQPIAAADRRGRIQPWQVVERCDFATAAAEQPGEGYRLES